MEKYLSEFKKALEKKFNKEVKEVPITKINKKEVGFILLDQNNRVLPTIYPMDFYEDYKKGITIDKIVDYLYRSNFDSQIEALPSVDFYTDWNNVSSLIRPLVIKKRGNADFLKTLPHLETGTDLAEIYEVHLENKEADCTYCVKITNTLLEFYNKSLEEIKDIARANARKDMVIKNMYYYLFEEYLDTPPEEIPEEAKNNRYPLWIFTNSKRLHGTGLMFDKEALNLVAKETSMPTFNIIPSSINELLVISEDVNTKEVKKMIADINKCSALDDEILSNSLYHYDGTSVKQI